MAMRRITTATSWFLLSRRSFTSGYIALTEKHFEKEIADTIPQTPYSYQKKDKQIHDKEDASLKMQHPEGGKWRTSKAEGSPKESKKPDKKSTKKPANPKQADFADEASGYYPENRDMADSSAAFGKM